MLKFVKFILLFIVLIFILISCGNEVPIINFPIYNILIYQEGSLNIPTNSIFLSVYFGLFDENGIDDIVSIKVIHTETEYEWNLPKEIISQPKIWQEKTYYGFPFLEYDNGKSILTGEYLIEIEDSAGNIADAHFFVEVEGLVLNEPYKVPDIKYIPQVENKNKEIKINGEKYTSCEIKFLGDASYFNGGRKKFPADDKIILNNNNPMPIGTKISIRVNKDQDEKVVYFLKNFTLE